jgi:hypothetical protein
MNQSFFRGGFSLLACLFRHDSIFATDTSATQQRQKRRCH